MAEGWVATPEGRHLTGRRKTSTTPEIALRRALHAAGARFRLHPRLAPGCTPDVVLPRHHVAVFVDGCFWHSCPIHGRTKGWTGPNAALWAAKMLRNRERDERSTALAQDLGWTVVRIWEHDVMRDAGEAAALVMLSATDAQSDAQP